MYEGQTYEVILQRMLNELPDDIDKREGSVAFDMLSPKALELAMSYKELENVLEIGFVNTTYGKWLDVKVSEAGITRTPAVRARGNITIELTQEGSQIVPKGTIVYTDSGVRFTTDKDITVTTGVDEVSITAIEPGIVGNVPARSIINIEIDNASCYNKLPTYDGLAAQSDESLLAEYYNKVQKPATSGNAYHYYQWAMDVNGIGDAKVIPTWNGGGTVKIVVISSEKTPVIETKITEVAQYIETQRPVGANVTVVTATSKPINITATVVLQSAQDVEEVTKLFKEKVTEYLKSVAFVQNDIKIAYIGSLLLATDGVLDYQDFTINGGTANIPVEDTEVAILGTVTFT